MTGKPVSIPFLWYRYGLLLYDAHRNADWYKRESTQAGMLYSCQGEYEAGNAHVVRTYAAIHWWRGPNGQRHPCTAAPGRVADAVLEPRCPQDGPCAWRSRIR